MKTLAELEKYVLNSRARSPIEFVSNLTLYFLQSIFSQRETGNYKFDSDENKTEITICTEYSDLSNESTMPAIVYVRGPLSNGPSTMSNSLSSLSLNTNKSYHMNLLNISSTLIVIHRNVSECEQLASELFILIKAFQIELKKLGLSEVIPQSIGETQSIHPDANPGLYLIPISISYTLSDSWNLEPAAISRLRNVLIKQN